MKKKLMFFVYICFVSMSLVAMQESEIGEMDEGPEHVIDFSGMYRLYIQSKSCTYEQQEDAFKEIIKSIVLDAADQAQ